MLSEEEKRKNLETVKKFNRQFPVGSTVEWRYEEAMPYNSLLVIAPAKLDIFGRAVANLAEVRQVDGKDMVFALPFAQGVSETQVKYQ